ncbi:MAG: PAS domain-containing sensor histidine kinase [Chloroflexi bacterium]|nr:PAS domain-containing sensor histidine kinase [Chloroflexota bacterium]
MENIHPIDNYSNLQKQYDQLRKEFDLIHHRFLLFTEYTNDLLWIMDDKLQYKYISPTVERLTGFTVKETLQKPLEEFYSSKSLKTINDIYKQEMAKDRKDLANTSHSILLELEAYCKNGSLETIELSITILRDNNGNINEVVGVTRKITERKKAEQEIESLYKKEREAHEKCDLEIKQRLEYTRALVHELKTPLTAMVASCGLLLEIATDVPTRKLANNIFRGVNSLNSRIDELLDLAKGELKILQLKRTSVNLSLLLQNIFDEMKVMFEDKGVYLVNKVPQSLPLIQADETRLRQVIQNLINNAYKWTPVGGSVILKAGVKEHHIVVQVQDTGPGLTEERKKTNNRSDEDIIQLKGLGLGLALAKILIELHGGEIWVEGEQGMGSTFCFSIPI